MTKLDKALSLPIVEPCGCHHCSKSNKSYIFKFKGIEIYFYCWEDKRTHFLYFIQCPYISDWDDFDEITFEQVFEILDEEYKEIIIFNLDLFT